MPDTLTTITKLINSPPGQLAAGGVLAGIVWKFFERVEAVLNEDTKLEIAVWLLGRKKFGPRVQPWPDTFAKLFDRVFGSKHFSLRCFTSSCIVALLGVLVATAVIVTSQVWSVAGDVRIDTGEGGVVHVPLVTFLIPMIVIGLFVPNLVSLLET